MKKGYSMNPIGVVNALYPMPATLVGTTANGKANFLTVAHVGILNHGIPQYLSIGLGKINYSNAAIHENRTFSICLPDEKLMAKTDFCGIMSGKTTDKVALFDLFYGKLKTAPMIRQCPVNMELSLYQVIVFPTHEVFIGELIQTYADERVVSDGQIDIGKVRPLLFDMSRKKYWSLGEELGECWKVGKTLKK